MADQKFAVRSGFYDAVNADRVYSADDMNRPYKRVISNGVFATPKGTPSTDLQVVASGSGMQIIVKAGEGIFADKWFENSSDINITVPSNTTTLPRIDSVIVQMDKRTSGRVGSIVYRTGTPASSAKAPSINTVTNVIEYRLANIRVNAGISLITGGMITDRRGSSDCPWVTSLIYQVDTSTLYDQWAEAYSEYFDAEKAMWDDWYTHLTEELDVSMSLVRLTNTVVTSIDTSEIQIGIPEYDSSTDLLEVYINGLRAAEGVQYNVNNNTSISLTAPIETGQSVDFVVLKSVIMGNAHDIMRIVRELESKIGDIAGGTPTVVESISDMTDTDKIYVLSTDGKWYYYNTTESEWTEGGKYGGVTTDPTLTQSGVPADAKATGDAIRNLENMFSGDIDDAVQDWMDSHPDAITTVQDGSITDIKQNDSLKYLFYDNVTTKTGRIHDTDYYITSVPVLDENEDIIDVSLEYDSGNPLEHAGKRMTTLTVNGFGKVKVNDTFIDAILIGNGTVLNSTSVEGAVPDNMLYIGIRADRSVIEYAMNSSITTEQMLADGCVNVTNCYFKLVENGEIVSALSEGTITINGTQITETMVNPLMLFGIKPNGEYAFLACDGRTDINEGLTYREAGELMISEGYTTVYNMDGGGSTAMIVRGSKINRDIDDDGTSVRKVHYTLNVKKPAENVALQEAYQKIGNEKQKLIEQIIPYVNDVRDSLVTEIGSAISSGEDLNDYVSEGKFYCANATIASSLSNCPSTVGFSMYCLQQGSTGRVITQIIITNPSSGSQKLYYRSVTRNSDGTFASASDWGNFLPDLEIVTLTPEEGVTIVRSKCTKSGRTVTLSCVFTTTQELPTSTHIFELSPNAVVGTTVDIILVDLNSVVNFAVAVSSGYIDTSHSLALPAGTYRMNVSWQV